MSEMPGTWAHTKLSEVAEVHDDLREPVNAGERSKRVGPYPYYGATGQVGWIDGFRQDGEYVLLGEDGAPFFDPAKPKAYLVTGKSWVNNHAHVLKGKDGICQNRFLLHALNHANYRGYANGTTRLKLTQGAMLELPIRLAPMREQRRVVEKLEELLSDLDAGIAALEHARANLKRYRAAVLNAAVEGRLTEKWRVAHPDADPAEKLLERIVTERRKKWEEAQLKKFAEKDQSPPTGWKDRYPEPAEPDIAALPALPKGWCWATLDQLADIGTGATPLRSESRYWSGGSIPWVTSAAVNAPFVSKASELVTPAALAETNLFLYPANTLILAMYGEGKTRGKVSELLLEATTNQALAALVFFESASACRSYVKTFLAKSYEDMRRIASGGVQPNMNLGLIKEMRIPLPPLDEQAQITMAIDRLLSVQERLVQESEKSALRGSRLRQAILKRAFEGKLVPQDPKDEPASELLARISASREVAAKGGSRIRKKRSAKKHLVPIRKTHSNK